MADVAYADLEIRLSSLGGIRYRVEARYWPTDDEALQLPVAGEIRLDPEDFLGLSAADEYGQALAERLFEPTPIRECFLLARQDTYSQTQDQTHDPIGLRVRLWFDAGTEQLHDLRWETLRGPVPGGLLIDEIPLSTHDLVPFSRFPTTSNNRRVRLRPEGELRTLVLIANPPLKEKLGDEVRLAEVDVHAEWDRVRSALQGLPPARLLARHPDAVGSPTRAYLLDELRAEYDIVYVVSHGALDKEGSFLLLETDDGQMDLVPGSVLMDVLSGLPRPPRLVLLTACQSAGTGLSTDNRAHMALGPYLIRAGVPAVLAMNGQVTRKTADKFFQLFFVELVRQRGCLDRATTTARRTIRGMDRPDWWMPVLYLRLSAGRIWSAPYVVSRSDEPYEELSLSLQNEQCTPILGPDLLDPLWGPSEVVAHNWAERIGFPLAPHQLDELPFVAQYLARRRTGMANRPFVVQSWMKTMEEMLRTKQPDLVDSMPRFEGLQPRLRIRALVSAAGSRLREDKLDPFRLLARMPVSVYLTATPDSLLVDALREATPQRLPIVEYARWNDLLERKNRTFDETKRDVVISRERPLVFHLFGTLDEPDSLVLTADDFINFLIHVVQDNDNRAIPALVREAWNTNALMMLGFDLDDWTFQALHRAIVSEQGHSLRLEQGILSAAVQLNPDEDRNLRPESALKYLEQTFNSQNIRLSWSAPDEFVRQVWQLLPAAMGGPG